MGKHDQVMLIVGGSSGMGLATARLAANNGLSGGDDDATMEVFQEVFKSQAVERIGRADEIAQGVIYLATNQFITGTTLFIDGGLAIS